MTEFAISPLTGGDDKPDVVSVLYVGQQCRILRKGRIALPFENGQTERKPKVFSSPAPMSTFEIYPGAYVIDMECGMKTIFLIDRICKGNFKQRKKKKQTNTMFPRMHEILAHQ